MAQGVLPFKYEAEKKSKGMTALAGLPVYAIATEKINYIPRAVIPVLGMPNTIPGNDSTTWGIGDVIGQLFISPKTEGTWKWGVGPQISLETRTDDALAGPGWGGGLAGVLVGGWGNLASATIVNHIWGSDGGYSTTMVQPMLFYNFESVPELSGGDDLRLECRQLQ